MKHAYETPADALSVITDPPLLYLFSRLLSDSEMRRFENRVLKRRFLELESLVPAPPAESDLSVEAMRTALIDAHSVSLRAQGMVICHLSEKLREICARLEIPVPDPCVSGDLGADPATGYDGTRTTEFSGTREGGTDETD